MRVAIIGVGLIGGSMARDLAAAGHDVVAWDRDGRALRAARRAGVLAGVLPAGLEGIERCDAAVLALPVDAAIALVRRRAAMLAQVPLITDVGSTKGSIVRAAAESRLGSCFFGAHPLAGDHTSGWAASRRGLFKGQRVYLTPTRETAPRLLARAARLWRALGGRPLAMTAASHDRLLARTSHLPQLASTALGLALAHRGIPRSALGRGGRDMTRLAASSARVWAAILADNRESVMTAVREYRDSVARIERAVRRGDSEAIARLIAAGNRWARE